jgi:NADH-quinone oxidoreductase subunit N
VLLTYNIPRQLIVELSSKSRENWLISMTLAVSILSSSGLPPLGGFVGKLLVLLAGVSCGYYLISCSLIIVSVLSCYYYVRLLVILYFTLNN